MLDLAELAHMETEYDRMARRQADIDRVFSPLTDNEARSSLERILAARRAGLAAERPHKAALLAQQEMERLAAGICGWAYAVFVPGVCTAEQFRTRAPQDQISDLINDLSAPVPLQPGGREGLRDALFLLTQGEQAALLRPAKTKRRGAQPGTAAEAKFELVRWIRWQHGRGLKVDHGIVQVAEAVGRCEKAIGRWQAKLSGYERMLCDKAEAIGRREAIGEDVRQDPLWGEFTRILHEATLQHLAARFRAATWPKKPK